MARGRTYLYLPAALPVLLESLGFAAQKDELSTADWVRVLKEARALGAVQLGFSGGEPLTRKDLEILVAEAHGLGYYTNLITSGAGLNEVRIRLLKEAGLDHIQLSFQDSTREVNDFLSSTRTFDLKRRVAGLIKGHGFPMVMNCVIHRLNIDHVDRIIDLAHEIGAEYLELANTQYYGGHCSTGIISYRAASNSSVPKRLWRRAVQVSVTACGFSLSCRTISRDARSAA